ncbi:hypothetical protein DFJ73DRAFT_755605 [Zopfochytrium polystomum]|nr:hypothetical protein DFJ73DRAFT_755605 [Zopfochytrium polystomum]
MPVCDPTFTATAADKLAAHIWLHPGAPSSSSSATDSWASTSPPDSSIQNPIDEHLAANRPSPLGASSLLAHLNEPETYSSQWSNEAFTHRRVQRQQREQHQQQFQYGALAPRVPTAAPPSAPQDLAQTSAQVLADEFLRESWQQPHGHVAVSDREPGLISVAPATPALPSTEGLVEAEQQFWAGFEERGDWNWGTTFRRPRSPSAGSSAAPTERLENGRKRIELLLKQMKP